jgi:hypothetical protein
MTPLATLAILAAVFACPLSELSAMRDVSGVANVQGFG